MNKKGHTPDERFLLKLYELSNAKGHPFNPIPSKDVAKAICHKETAVKNMIKLLAQANFIKKVGETSVCLTKQGCAFVLSELE
jgi:Mn-dependent DtxR family transcriptional regulator